MADDQLIVPIEIPSGNLQFATISHNGTIHELLDSLTGNVETVGQIIGDLPPYGFAIQQIRKEHNGRQWEEEELESLGNGELHRNIRARY